MKRWSDPLLAIYHLLLGIGFANLHDGCSTSSHFLRKSFCWARNACLIIQIGGYLELDPNSFLCHKDQTLGVTFCILGALWFVKCFFFCFHFPYFLFHLLKKIYPNFLCWLRALGGFSLKWMGFGTSPPPKAIVSSSPIFLFLLGLNMFDWNAVNKLYHGWQNFFSFLSFFFPIFSFCSKSGNHPKDLGKSGYKTNREVKKSRNTILLVV